MPYSEAAIHRLYQALGYERKIQTKSFGELEYPRPEVWAFHKSKARIKIALSPARTSKSYAGAYDLIPDLLEFDRPEKHLIVGPDYDKTAKEFGYVADALVHRRDATAKLLGVPIPAPSVYSFNPKQGRMHIVWPWGAELVGKSAVHFSSVLGESWGVAILSEACELGPEIFYRGLRTRCRRFILPTTPGLKGIWVKSLYDEAVANGDRSVELFRFPPESNPLYDMDRFKEELRRRGPDDPYFKEQFLGEWVFYGGRVFPVFQPEPVEKVGPAQLAGESVAWLDPKVGVRGGEGRVCIDMDPLLIPPHWKRIAGMDYGFSDHTVHLWGAVCPDGSVIAYDEYYANQQSSQTHADAIKAISRDNGTRSIEDRIREPKGQAKQLAYDYASQHGLYSRPCPHADRISSRVHMQAYLEPRRRDGQPSLRIISARCPNLVRELTNLHYEDQDGPRREGQVERWKGDDHAVDCCRYMLSSLPSPHPEDEIEAHWRSIDALKRRKKRLLQLYGKVGHDRPGV